MPQVPNPTFRWRDAAEKEWVFRRLYMLGYKRQGEADVEEAWTDLEHDSDLDYMCVENAQIFFTSARSGSIFWCLTRTNSGRAMIDYLILHKMVYPRAQ